MKKAYIVALLAVIAAITIIVSASKDVTNYVSFEEAALNQSRVKVSGVLNKDHPVDYDPIKSPNIVTFEMIDQKGQSNKVILKQAKPQDFELSESVVVTGTMKDDIFVADEVLLKCPSKYKDEELTIRGES